MKTILAMMALSEIREYGQMRHADYEKIKRIVEKPFLYVTTGDIYELAKTDIFDYAFPDLLFQDLWKRYTETERV